MVVSNEWLGGGAQAEVMTVAVSYDDGVAHSGNSDSDGSGNGGQVVVVMDSDTGGDDGSGSVHGYAVVPMDIDHSSACVSP
jgi:hypothetical protein